MVLLPSGLEVSFGVNHNQREWKTFSWAFYFYQSLQGMGSHLWESRVLALCAHGQGDMGCFLVPVVTARGRCSLRVVQSPVAAAAPARRRRVASPC